MRRPLMPIVPFPAPVLLAVPLPGQLPRTQELTATGPDLTQYVLVCLGLLGLILALAWVFRRFFAQALRRRAARRSLSVLDVLPLGRKQKLVVVRCYDRNFLLGLGEREVTQIAELDPDEPEAATPPAEPVDTDSAPPVEAERAAPLPFRSQLEREFTPARPPGWERGRGVLG